MSVGLISLYKAQLSNIWQEVGIGTGGLITEISGATDGTKVCKTDSFGGYVWPAGGTRWNQLLTGATTAVVPTDIGFGDGFEAIAICESDSNYIYWKWNGRVYKSTDRGATGSLINGGSTGFPILISQSQTAGLAKSCGYTMAVDPNNRDVVYCGTLAEGLYFTSNGGTGWSLQSQFAGGLPYGGGGTAPGVAPPTYIYGFDQTSNTFGTGSKTFNSHYDYTLAPASFPALPTSGVVQVALDQGGSNALRGTITSQTADSFTINVTSTNGTPGAGPFNFWYVLNYRYDNTSTTLTLGTHTFNTHTDVLGNSCTYTLPVDPNKFVELQCGHGSMAGFITGTPTSTSFDINIVSVSADQNQLPGPYTGWTIYNGMAAINQVMAAGPDALGIDTTTITPATGPIKFRNPNENFNQFGFTGTNGILSGYYATAWSKSDPSKQVYGLLTNPSIAITNATWSGGVATFTVSSDPRGCLFVGDSFYVSGINPSGFNTPIGDRYTSSGFTVASVSATQVTCALANPGASYVSGGALSTRFNNVSISNATWAATSGGQVTFTVSADTTATVIPGNKISVRGVLPAEFNGQLTVVSVSSTQIVCTMTVNPGSSYVSGGNLFIGYDIIATTAFGSGSASDWYVSGQFIQLGNHRIAFDKSGGTTTVSGQTRTKNIYVNTYGVGTWRSTDGGVTWTLLSAPTSACLLPKRMVCDKFGVLWMIDVRGPYGFSGLTTYDPAGPTWTPWLNLGSGGGTGFGVAVNDVGASTKAQVVVAYNDNAWSFDGGATWTLQARTPGSALAVASVNDVGWNVYNENQKGSVGVNPNGVWFDPSHPGRCYISSEGTYYFTPVAGNGNNTIFLESRGIEEFIGNSIVCGNTNDVVMTCWDLPIFQNSNFGTYPAKAGGTDGSPLNWWSIPLTIGYGPDYQWDNPNNMVCLIANSNGGGFNGPPYDGACYSTDAGHTWTIFPNQPAAGLGYGFGTILISSLSYIVFVPTYGLNGGNIRYTTDLGATAWHDLDIVGTGQIQGWTPTSYSSAYTKGGDSDKGNGDLIVYNWSIDNLNAQAGFYKYTKASNTWARVGSDMQHPGSGTLGDYFHTNQIKSVSGKPGHYFFNPEATGNQGQTIYFTDDNWTTWPPRIISEIRNASCAPGFGKAFPGKYPSMFVCGDFTGMATDIHGISQSFTSQKGVWLCKDFNTTTGTGSGWVMCGDTTNYLPGGVLSLPVSIDGDKQIAGKVYTISNGGAWYGTFS